MGTEVFTDDIEVRVLSNNATPNDDTDDFMIDDAQTITGGLASGAISTLTFSWTAPYTIGRHVLTATATYGGYPDENPNNDVNSTSVEVMDPATPTTMHIEDLDGGSTWWNSWIWKATVDVFVEDNLGNLVGGATVNISWSDGSTDYLTTINGWCQFIGYQFFWTPSLTLTVEAVSFPDLTYISGDNHDPDGDSNGSSITVKRPQ